MYETPLRSASVGFTVAHSVDPIFQHIFDGMALNGLMATSISCFRSSIVSGWLA